MPAWWIFLRANSDLKNLSIRGKHILTAFECVGKILLKMAYVYDFCGGKSFVGFFMCIFELDKAVFTKRICYTTWDFYPGVITRG